MDKDDILHLIEDLFDSSLPLTEYCVRLYRDNGDYELHIHHKADINMEKIDDMYGLSEIFNSYTEDWKIEKCSKHYNLRGALEIIVK